MSLATRDAVKARLESQIPSRTVYAGAVPDGPLPARYLVVWASNGDEFASSMCDATDVAVPVVWVTSVSRNDSPRVAADEAAWGADRARAVLRDWRPALGTVAWKLRPVASEPARRDDSIPQTTFVAVEQFTAMHQI